MKRYSKKNVVKYVKGKSNTVQQKKFKANRKRICECFL